MKNLISLSNDLLLSETQQAASNEKAATLILLEHLAEIDRRRLYAVRGYSSLWEYVHKALQYSEAQAYDRVSAMRLMVRVPEVKAELRSGKLTLTTTAKLGAHARRGKLRPEETVTLLREISGKPSREVERVLVSQSTEPRRAWATRRAAGPVIHFDCPAAVAIFPSIVWAVLETTKGMPLVIYLINTSLSFCKSSSKNPTLTFIPAFFKSRTDLPLLRGLGSIVPITASLIPL